VQSGEVNGSERAQKAPFHRRAVDIGIGACRGILDDEDLRVFRVVGVIVDERFNEKAVADRDQFILVEHQLWCRDTRCSPPGLQLVSTDVGFIQDGIVHLAFAQEIAAGQVGVAEMKVDRVDGRDAVESIEFKELGRGTQPRR